MDAIKFLSSSVSESRPLAEFTTDWYLYVYDAEGMDNKSYWIDGSECLEATYGLFQCTFPQCKIPRFYNTGEAK